MGKWLLFLPPALFLGLAVLFYTGMSRDDPDALPSTLEGRIVPDLTLEPIEGLVGFDPQVLRAPGVKLVNFWASWCGPCRAEHPMLKALAAEGVPIYGVNYKDKVEDAKGFLAELGNPYTGIGADAGRMALDWGVYGMPETFVINGEGRVILRIAGPVTKSVLDSRLRPALAEAAR